MIMQQKLASSFLISMVSLTMLPASADSQIQLSDNLELETGGRVIARYRFRDIDDELESYSYNEWRFRQIRPYLQLSYAKDWQLKIAYEFGTGKNSLKDVYFRYKGFDWLDIKLGNETLPFSRERMTSSQRQQGVGRTLAGDTEFGVPGRQLGVHLATKLDWPVQFYLSAAQANVYGDLLTEIQFISPLSKTKVADWQQDEGDILVARADFSLWKQVNYSEGDFKGSQKLTLSVAAFDWQHDKTVVEIDDIKGQEVSLAYRGFGLSSDLEYQTIEATSPFSLERPLFQNGEAELSKVSWEIGYMWSSFDVETYVSSSHIKSDFWLQDWRAKEVGLNYFLDKHNNKLQVSFSSHENGKGQNQDENRVSLQWVYRF